MKMNLLEGIHEYSIMYRLDLTTSLRVTLLNPDTMNTGHVCVFDDDRFVHRLLNQVRSVCVFCYEYIY